MQYGARLTLEDAFYRARMCPLAAAEALEKLNHRKLRDCPVSLVPAGRGATLERVRPISEMGSVLEWQLPFPLLRHVAVFI